MIMLFVKKRTLIPYVGLLGFFAASILHNLMYALGWSFLEGGFFILSFLLLLVGLIFIPVNLVTYLMWKKPEDSWKLGWLGFLGVAFYWMTPYAATLTVLFGFFLFKPKKA